MWAYAISPVHMKRGSTKQGVFLLDNAFFHPQLLNKITNKINEQQDKPGLYVVATPIGNIFDISLRAIYILRKAKFILTEDTRESRKLLNFYEINTHLVACHEHNESDIDLMSMMNQKEMYAIISDAGTPLISDPGYRVINWCIKNNINVVPIPGACSCIAGISAAGLPTDVFSFYGFLPNKSIARKKIFEQIKNVAHTLIFFESPKRITKALQDMRDIFGERYCCVSREITKIFETFYRGNISDVLSCFTQMNPVGEFVIMISGNCEASHVPSPDQLINEIRYHLLNNSLKDVALMLSDKYGTSKNFIYQRALDLKKEINE